MADAIRVSSNIAIAKFAARLTPEEQYAMLRDFGFGALTGIEFPAEATGRLRPPSEWTRPSAASLAMGYELSVTPIQVAMARSEEHTSELQSRQYLVCRLLLEKKNEKVTQERLSTDS